MQSTQNRQDQILTELRKIEQQHQVTILYAAEAGSRAWGFASPDSDYDVRFIYVRPLPWYVSVSAHPQAKAKADHRDVIELPISEDLDINGWDLQKALHLLRQSNPAVQEWAASPVVYMTDLGWVPQFQALITRGFSEEKAYYHYTAMAKSNFREYLQGPMVRYKKYLYVLRPLLAARWIRQGRGMPPLSFLRLAATTLAEADPQLHQEILRLVEVKMEGNEGAVTPPWPLLQQFIEYELGVARQWKPASTPLVPYEDLDAFFCSTVLKHQQEAFAC